MAIRLLPRSAWRRGPVVWVVAALTGLIVSGLAWYGRDDVVGATDGPTSGVAAWFGGHDARVPQSSVGASFRTGLEGVPASLVGTDVDGDIQADGQGQLVLNRRLRDLFDYFLSVLGEESISTVSARMAAYARGKVPASAATQALALWDRYVAYGEARGRLGASDGSANGQPDVSVDALTARVAQVQALRAQYFSEPERQAFFQEDDEEDRFTLARMQIWQDKQLSAQDKAVKLQQLKEGLPAAVRERLSPADAVSDLRAVTAAWQAQGGSPDALREARVKLVGEAAAQRLEALDEQRAQWSARVQAYQARLSAIHADGSLSALQRDQAVQQLREQGFTAAERLRLDGLMARASP